VARRSSHNDYGPPWCYVALVELAGYKAKLSCVSSEIVLHPVRTLLYGMFVEPVLRLWRRMLAYVF
jgi:hypothetical protein